MIFKIKYFQIDRPKQVLTLFVKTTWSAKLYLIVFENTIVKHLG
jgi:hypothetical protein